MVVLEEELLPNRAHLIGHFCSVVNLVPAGPVRIFGLQVDGIAVLLAVSMFKQITARIPPRGPRLRQRVSMHIFLSESLAPQSQYGDAALPSNKRNRPDRACYILHL